MQRSFNDVLKTHLACGADMRHAANMPGVSRVADAPRIRGLQPKKEAVSHGGRLPASLLALHKMSRHYNKCPMSTVRKPLFLTDTEG
jgi:hypothetical protein